jgi:hypothetical protein
MSNGRRPPCVLRTAAAEAIVAPAGAQVTGAGA